MTINDHVEYVCPGGHDSTCQFCDGGLFACSVCDAFEGATPDECPSAPMTREQSNEVYAGQLNYRDGAWREGECCQVMRPIHDKDNFMAENGYEPCGFGHWSPLGEQCKWTHLHEGATS